MTTATTINTHDRQRMETANLKEFSKSLELSHKEHSEEFIHEALRAHGIFQHGRPATKRRDKVVARCISEEDKTRTTQLISHFKEGREFHTLKEPRHLYGYTQSSPHDRVQTTLPFWPSEVECIRERGTHLMIPPKHTEPYYTVDSDLVSPKIRSGEGYGKVVYTNLPGPEKYFVKSRQGPSVNLPPAQTPSSTELSLEFESRFESGNLGKAVQVGRWDYELYLRYDLYTRKHTQWFYFRVRNMQAGQRYRFTIVNLYKAGSLYNEGMQPAFYSERLAKERRIGWHRAGHNIKYFKTPIKRLDTKQESFCYGVTWSHTFKHNGDTCYFAHSFPYTYSNLQDYLQKTLMNRNKAQFCKYKVLCRTIAGNSVPLLTITSPSPTPDDSQAKRGVVVTARIHPGETNGSWMMKGLLDFLTSSADDAKILRDLFVFKIVPMLNPDGVIVGNYRCSLTGRDLNRNYRSKLKDSYPTVWHTRNLVKQFCKEREVVLFCDLHGHSRKHNIFIYGCDTLNDASSRLKSRVFPRMLFKNAPDMFSYNSSRFVVQKSKEGTGRVVMWREAGIQNSYTLEATFAGSTQGKLRGVQFTTAHLEGMGYHLCDTLLDYCDPDQSKTERIMRELEEDYRKSVVAALAALGREVPPGVDPLDIEIDPALAEAESSDAGSDSSESDGPPVHVQWKRHHKTKKKKRLKSRRERNKQKALLKMNHHQQRAYSIPSPSLSQPTDTQSQTSKKPQPESKEEKRTEPVCAPQQSFDVLGSQASAHTYIYNGGIPTFVQDRLEERQRRREEEGASDALGGVPPEELRLALMHIQATHTQKTPSSTVFIPHPSCPMNISQINIHEASRRQSRLSSKVSLPKLDSATSGSLVPKELPPLFQATRSKGAFTSQYVAHHLQHIGANTTATENSINSTQNLSNLSRLFRQLHPKAYHTPHTEDDLQSLHFKPPPNTAYHGKVESNKQEQNDNHQLQNDKLREMDYLVPNETREEPREESVDAMNTTQTDGRPCSSGTQGGSDRSLSSSYSSYFNKGSGGSSPMTNSWKGFSQGVTYLKHKQETKKNIVTVRDQQEGRKKPTVVSRNKKQHGVVYTNSGEANRVLIDAQLAAEKGGEENYQRYVAKEQTGRRHYLEGHTEAVPTTLPQPRSCSPTKYIELPIDKTRTAAIKAHKQGIADAVEHAHTMQTHDKRSPANMQTPSSDSLPKLISKSRSDPLPCNNITSRLVTPLPNDHGHLQPRAHQRLEQQAVADFRTSVNKNGNDTMMMGKGNRADKVKLKAIEYVRKGRSVERMDNTVAYYDETTCTRPEATHADTMSPPYTTTEDEEAQLRRVYSSKPPSRYGPRPGPDDGVPPATVSIMLSGRLRSNSRPSTMHSSSRRHGKHAHIRYFTKKT